MSQDSQCSVNSLELMSQETHEVLQALLNDGGKGPVMEQPEFQAKYRLLPYDIHLAEENSQGFYSHDSGLTRVALVKGEQSLHSTHDSQVVLDDSNIVVFFSDNLEINIERLCSYPRPCKSEPLDFNPCTDGSPQLSQPMQNHLINPTSFESQQPLPPPQQQQQTNNLISQLSRSLVDNSIYSKQCLVPSNTDFPGHFLFDIGFEEEKGPPVKSAPWTYSPQLQKLFIKMRCIVPIRFKIRGCPPPGSYIKALVVFNKPEHYREIVERCLNHITQQNDGHHAPKHLLRCENASTLYETCPLTGRHFIKIPIREAEAGTDYFTEMFQFMCFNSCPGGLNRRPIIAIFTLEYNDQVMGRKILNPRICACPGRDRGGEETSEQKKKCKNLTNAETTHPQPEQVSSSSSFHETPPSTPVEDTKSLHQDNNKLLGKRSATKITEGFQLQSLSAYKKIKREDDEIFTIQVRGREKYELLLKIKEGIDLMDMVPQSYLDNYRMGCAPCGPNWFLKQQGKENAEKRGTLENSPDSQEISNSQNSDCEGTPPSSFPYSLSELSSSNASRSSQGSNPGNGPEYATVKFTLKRTVSLEKKGLKKKETE